MLIVVIAMSIHSSLVWAIAVYAGCIAYSQHLRRFTFRFICTPCDSISLLTNNCTTILCDAMKASASEIQFIEYMHKRLWVCARCMSGCMVCIQIGLRN